MNIDLISWNSVELILLVFITFHWILQGFLKTDNFITSFKIGMPFFSCLIAFLTTSGTMTVEEKWQKWTCLFFSWSWGKQFFCQYDVRDFHYWPSSFSLLNVFLMKGVMDFVKGFFYFYKHDYVGFLPSILLIWYITLIDVQKFNQPYIPGINLTWLWWTIPLHVARFGFPVFCGGSGILIFPCDIFGQFYEETTTLSFLNIF